MVFESYFSWIMHFHKHFCATFVIFCSFSCLTSLNQHVLKNKYALFIKSNNQTNLFWFRLKMFFSGSTSLENTTVEKSVSMNTTVNGSSSWSCSSLINPEAGKIGATVALSLILAVSLIGNFLIVLLVYKTPTLRPVSNVIPATAVLSWLDCSWGCSMKLAPLGFRRRI